MVCNPNDPTGELMSLEELDHLLSGLPERVVTFLDEFGKYWNRRDRDVPEE